MSADITPNEILQKRFSQAFRGINPMEVYDFLLESTKDRCTVSVVLGGPPCGKCLICRAKALEARLRERYVTLGWRTTPCKSCKGSGVQQPRRKR